MKIKDCNSLFEYNQIDNYDDEYNQIITSNDEQEIIDVLTAEALTSVEDYLKDEIETVYESSELVQDEETVSLKTLFSKIKTSIVAIAGGTLSISAVGVIQEQPFVEEVCIVEETIVDNNVLSFEITFTALDYDDEYTAYFEKDDNTQSIVLDLVETQTITFSDIEPNKIYLFRIYSKNKEQFVFEKTYEIKLGGNNV